MASSTSTEADKQIPSASTDEQQLKTSLEIPPSEDSNSDDHVQRTSSKRPRMRSRFDENPPTTNNNEEIEPIVETRTSAVHQKDETQETKTTTSPNSGPVKRRRLNVEIEEVLDRNEASNDSAVTTTTTDESKDFLTTTTTDDDDDDDDEDEKNEDEDDDEEEQLPSTTNILQRLRQRELGGFTRRPQRETCRAFHDATIGSRNLIQRMKISHKLNAHNGCVNALAFNRTGTLLASGSDDLQVIIWDWAIKQVAVAYDSNHSSNVFQAKFVPYSDDCKIVSCARDGQVRLAQLNPDGSLAGTRKIAQHFASAHKLAIETIAGQEIFSCGEDGAVYQIDLRESRPNKLLVVSNSTINKLPLYSIELNRSNQNEFVVAGLDPYVRVFDRRFIDSLDTKPLKSFCPDLLKKIEDRQRQPSVTCAVYNHNGTEILGSYNDDDIYLFDATHSDGADAIRHYTGHRNSNTVKGVNFYGRNSEYIISGSDCGHVFIWDKYSEKCIWFDNGDRDGTVNVLEPHPHFPVIATSGLEHDIKIWSPLRAQPVDLKRLKLLNKRNAKEREHELHFASVLDTDTGGLLRLMRPVFRRMVRRANGGEEESDNDDDDDDDDDDDEDSDHEATAPGRHIYSFDCAPS